MKTILIPGISLLALVSLFACSSSSSGTADPTGAGGSTGAGAGAGVGPGAGGSSTGAGGGCGTGKGGGSGETPECTSYGTCIQNSCDAEYQAALGPNWKSGMFSGPCKEYFDCTAACGPCDSACSSACSPKLTGNMACVTAFTAVGMCAQAHCMTEETACANSTKSSGTGGSGQGAGGTSSQGAGGGGAKYTCADLTACCNGAMFPAAAKDGCLQFAMMGMESACSSAVSSYKMAHLCN